MKKLILLPLLALFVASCSTDEVSSDIQASESNSSNTARAAVPYEYEPSWQSRLCGYPISGETFIDYPGSFGSSPNITFIGSASTNDPQPYNVYIVFETLVDCEDLDNGTGETITYFLGNLSNLDTVPASITLKPWDIFQDCYRWRYVYDRPGTKIFKGCSSYSPWYDAPLY